MKKLVLVVCLLLTGCAQAPLPLAQAILPPPAATDQVATFVPVSTEPPVEVTAIPTSLPQATQSQETVTPQATQDPANWRSWPVIPNTVSDAMKQVYQAGLKQGHDPHRFSKVGDCQNVPSFFLGQYDQSGTYDLGSHQPLQNTIDWFSSSWSRFPPSVHGGQNIVAVQMAHPLIRFDNNGEDACHKGESYLDCEVRLWNPGIVVVSFEELWDGNIGKYNSYYEQLIQNLLGKNIVPLLVTTATNEAANEKIAELSIKYGLPVWNLWAALQPLPGRGIADGFHLTVYGRIYDFTDAKPSGWNIRNTTGLMSIDSVYNLLAH